MTWEYNDTTGGYMLLAEGAALFVNPRFRHVAVVYAQRRDDEQWTCSLGAGAGIRGGFFEAKRWKHSEGGVVFEGIEGNDPYEKFLSYEQAFKTPGLPEEGKRLAERVLEVLKDTKPS